MALEVLKGVEKIGGKWRGFKYAHSTGNIYRNHDGARRIRAGVVGAKNSRGYLHFGHAKKYHRNSRVAYEIMTKEALSIESMIDHRNGKITDNRWCNLRKTNARGNSCNKVFHRDGAIPGGSFHKASGKFISQICVNGKIKYLGLFNSIEQAQERYNRESRGVEGTNQA